MIALTVFIVIALLIVLIIDIVNTVKIAKINEEIEWLKDILKGLTAEINEIKKENNQIKSNDFKKNENYQPRIKRKYTRRIKTQP